MRSITSRLSRVLLTDLPAASKASQIPPRLVCRRIHTTPSTRKDDTKLTNPQQWRQAIWGEAGPATDPYKELTPEEREKREIQYIEEKEVAKLQKKNAATKAEKEKLRKEREATYSPEEDARNMLVVGTRGAYMKKKWDPEHRVWRFLLTRLETPEAITAAVRRAVVETYTLAITNSKPIKACQFYRGPEYLTEKVKITRTEDGKDYMFDFRRTDIMDRIQSYSQKKQPLKSDMELVEGIENARGDEWKGMTLGGASLKFAVLKRSMQLTGIPLTDPVIHSISTAGQLVAQFHRILAHGTQTRLAPTLANDEVLSENANVTVHQHQLKFTDKERAIGRLETIPIMMAGRLKREGEVTGRGHGLTRSGRRMVSRSMLKLRTRKMKGWGVNGIQRFNNTPEKAIVQ